MTDDFNGDGLDDILATNHSDTRYAWVGLSNGNGSFARFDILDHSDWKQGSGSSYLSGDFNGDGKSDIAALISFVLK